MPQLENAPSLIILSTWLNAAQHYITKYVEHYLRTYPDTPILHLSSSTSDFFASLSGQQRDLEPALELVKTHLSDGKSSNRILVHAFSNGGGSQVAYLAKSFMESEGRPLPARAFIFDSLPGRTGFQDGIWLMSEGLPKIWLLRLPFQIIFGLMIGVFFTIPEMLGRESAVIRFRKYLNTSEICHGAIPRLYIYSTQDPFVKATDVEDHIAQAKENNMVVEVLRFEDSDHVKHMKTHPQRYWERINSCWTRASKL